MRFRLVLKWLLVASVTSTLFGCASVGRQASSQLVNVTTEPNGAAKVDGLRLPGAVRLKRELHPLLELETERGSLQVPLATRFRWSRSLFGNMFFSVFGISIDLLAGTAWEIKDPPTILIRSGPPALTATIAIAPPQTSDMALADAVGKALGLELRARGFRSVRPYNETLEAFNVAGYDYDSYPDSITGTLNGRVPADEVFESWLETSDSGSVEVRGQIRNVYTGELTAMAPLKVTNANDDALLPRFISRLIPNSIGLDLTESYLRFRNGGPNEFRASPVTDETWWSAPLRYISAINLSNVPVRRQGRAGRFVAAFVPKLSASRYRVKIAGINSSGFGDEQEYLRLSLLGGYAGEVGYQKGAHLLYFDFTPLLYWSQTTWQQGQSAKSLDRSGLTLQIELGYLYSFGKSWYGRLFTRSTNEDRDAWAAALGSRLAPGAVNSLEATEIVAGFSFGYRFSRDLPPVKFRPASAL